MARSLRQIDTFLFTRECRCSRILEWLRTQLNGATKSQIDRSTGIRTKPLTEALETLLESGSIARCRVKARWNHEYDGYRINTQS